MYEGTRILRITYIMYYTTRNTVINVNELIILCFELNTQIILQNR